MNHGKTGGISRRTVLAAGAAACCAPTLAFGERFRPDTLLKISVDTAANHVRNEALGVFEVRLGEETGHAMQATVFSSAQLAKDRDIVKALHWGLVDIGVPALSKMTRFDANANLFTLPMFYGSDLSTVYAINDGPIGAELYRLMEEKTKTHMLGRSLDLGYTNLYTTERRVRSISDMKGLKIRVPGSRASLELYKLFDANPIVIPFSDLAIAVSQGNVDAVQTTHETLRSGQMWESGIRFCYEERSSYLGYVPLISLRTWHAMSESDQQRITAVWESIVDDSRLLAQRRQQSAREELEQNGIEIFSDVEALSAARRGELFDRSVLLAKELGMDMSLVSAAADVLDAMRPDGVA
tara:strand:+ start:30684 stop:31745 length:1062 start_codon:yes stop_codon:yes gene_type:complete